jgi:ketosteroid isomerase-like protein
MMKARASGDRYKLELKFRKRASKPDVLGSLHKEPSIKRRRIMGAAENKQLVQHMFAELSKGNAEAFLGHMADDIRWTIIGTTKFSGTFQGKQEILDKILTPLSAQLAGLFIATVERLIAEDDYVVMQEHGTATTKTGKPYNNTYCVVFRIAKGKVQEMMEYLDTELVTAAFGKA